MPGAVGADGGARASVGLDLYNVFNSNAVLAVHNLGEKPVEVALNLSPGEAEQLVGLFDAGLREPLPIACKTSAAYAQGEKGTLYLKLGVPF